MDYDPYPQDRAGEKIDKYRTYEHLHLLADDATWFQTTDANIWAVAPDKQDEIDCWSLFDLLIIDRTDINSVRITHVETETTYDVSDHDGPDAGAFDADESLW